MTPELVRRKTIARARVSAAVQAPEGLGYVEGDIMDLSKATIPLNDRGYLLGDGVFETLRTSGPNVFRLKDHAERLGKGLRAIGLEIDVLDDFHAAVQALVKAGHATYRDDLYLRVNISTGPMDGMTRADRGIMVTGLVKRFKPYPMQYYAKGIQVVLSKQRKDSRNPLCGIKSLSFLPFVAARREAHSVTAHDAILLNEHGRVAEASTSNIFAIKGQKVYAPGVREGALPGVTRAVVLELIEDTGLELVRSMTVAQLRSAHEAFLTNTTGGIVPITRFDDKPIGKGKRGDVTAQLSHGLEALLRRHD